jgi:hypothetical protein
MRAHYHRRKEVKRAAVACRSGVKDSVRKSRVRESGDVVVGKEIIDVGGIGHVPRVVELLRGEIRA